MSEFLYTNKPIEYTNISIDYTSTAKERLSYSVLVLLAIVSSIFFLGLKQWRPRNKDESQAVFRRRSLQLYTYTQAVLAILQLTGWTYTLFTKDTLDQQLRPVLHVLSWMCILAILIAAPSLDQYRSTNYIYCLAFAYTCVLLEAIYLVFADNLTKPIDQYWAYTNFSTCTVLLIVICVIPLPLHPDNLSSAGGDIIEIKENCIYRNGKPLTPEATASLYSWLTFSWLNPLISGGYRKIASGPKGIYTMNSDSMSRFVYAKFRTAFSSTGRKLWRSTLQANGGLIIIRYVAALLNILFPYIAVFYQERFLSYIENSEGRSITVAYGFAIGMFISHVLPIICQTISVSTSRKWSMRARMMMNAAIYDKALKRKDASGKHAAEKDSDDDSSSEGDAQRSYSSNGRISNLLENDVSQLANAYAYIYIHLFTPIEIMIGLFSLYLLLGPASFVGIGLMMIVVFPLTWVLTNKATNIFDTFSTATDNRSDLVSEVLHGVRTIKYFALEANWIERIMTFRRAELKQAMKARLYIIFMIAVSDLFPFIIATSSFIWYTKVSGHELTASVAFVSITLFELIRSPLERLPGLVTVVSQILVQSKRIMTFLDEPEVDGSEWAEANQPTMEQDANLTDGVARVGFEKSVFRWHLDEEVRDRDDTQDETAALHDTSFQLSVPALDFPIGELSIVCGDTASGKSSLLSALLGEMSRESGRVYLPSKYQSASQMTYKDPDHPELLLNRVAYVCQEPFLQHTTIRDNILFGEPYEETRYKKALYQCALVADLKHFPDFDLTEIGEKGVTLSGGQKQRVSLARAIYSSAKTLLFDDFLSAVDYHTANHIYEKCLKGDLIQGRTTILVTYHVLLCLPKCKYLVKLVNGEVVTYGNAHNVKEEDIDISLDPIQIDIVKDELAIDDFELANSEDIRNHTLIENEKSKSGSVRLGVYFTYLKVCGGWFFWTTIIILTIAVKFASVAKAWWLRVWTSAYRSTPTSNNMTSGDILSNTFLPSILSPNQSEEIDLDYYIINYLLICLSGVLMSIVQDITLNWGSLSGSLRIFEELLVRIMHAPILFFDKTPIGRILNRFSTDLRVVDASLANSMSGMVSVLVGIIFSILVISAITPEFVVVGVVVAIIDVTFGYLYIGASRELKRANSVDATPIYTLFSETLDGISTIRAYSNQNRFMEKFFDNNDAYVGSSFLNYSMHTWIHDRFDIMGAILTLFSSLFILWKLDSIDAGMAGISSFYATTFNTYVSMMIQQYVSIELNLTSVERLQEYMQTDQEAPAIIKDHRPPAAWPTTAAVQVRDLKVRYSPLLEPVLHGISFEVRPHERVAVVGRSGSGKSTLALSFFRFVEAMEGSITIDGINIQDIGIQDLRSKLTIIPQEAVLFSGTIRSNLDPFENHSHGELWEALQRVHLARPSAEIEVLPEDISNASTLRYPIKSLDQVVSDGGKNFSQGERQLICMARALLRNSKLIFMDEATSSIDHDMDARIQRTIRTEFASSTLICIAHRLRTVIDYDRVLVLNEGKVVEYDTPDNLLSQEQGFFRALCEQSGEFDTLVDMAREASLHNQQDFGVADDHRPVH